VGRHYAGVLGSIAFTTIVVRGLIEGAGVESTLRAAAISTVLFTAIGYVVGRMAGWIVLESVRQQMAAAIAVGQTHPKMARATNESTIKSASA